MSAKRFTASIFIPGSRSGEFEITKSTDTLEEAKHWMREQIGKHPSSDKYAIIDNQEQVIVWPEH